MTAACRNWTLRVTYGPITRLFSSSHTKLQQHFFHEVFSREPSANLFEPWDSARSHGHCPRGRDAVDVFT